MVSHCNVDQWSVIVLLINGRLEMFRHSEAIFNFNPVNDAKAFPEEKTLRGLR